jgi:hypothetical protein
MKTFAAKHASNAWQALSVVVLALCAVSLVAWAAPKEAPALPDGNLTPGELLKGATAAQVCKPGYAGGVRNVSDATKRKVFAEYGITPKPHEFEVDHLVSLELGGSNDIKNLWPQSYVTKPWNAHVKDKLEDKLHTMVCHGKLPLKTAQQALRTNWIDAYKKYVGGLP